MYINISYVLWGLKTIVKIITFILEKGSLINVCLNWEVGHPNFKNFQAEFIDIEEVYVNLSWSSCLFSL